MTWLPRFLLKLLFIPNKSTKNCRFLLENGKVFTGKNYETKKFDKLGNDIGAEKDYCIYSIARIGML